MADLYVITSYLSSLLGRVLVSPAACSEKCPCWSQTLLQLLSGCYGRSEEVTDFDEDYMQTPSVLQACSLPMLGKPVAFSLQRTTHSGVTSGAGCGVTTFKADQLLIPLILLKWNCCLSSLNEGLYLCSQRFWAVFQMLNACDELTSKLFRP